MVIQVADINQIILAMVMTCYVAERSMRLMAIATGLYFVVLYLHVYPSTIAVAAVALTCFESYSIYYHTRLLVRARRKWGATTTSEDYNKTK